MSKWFVIQSGEHAGLVHMGGWMKTAIQTVDGWLALSVCPRCSALVIADDRHAYGDRTWAHEQWHAATDWPVPTDVADQRLHPFRIDAERTDRDQVLPARNCAETKRC